MDGDRDYVSSTEAARRLGVSACTVRRAVRRGALQPALQTPGGWLRFRASDVDTYRGHLASLAQAPGAPRRGGAST